MSYACFLWYILNGKKGHRKCYLQMLQTVQSRAARTITEAFRETARPALDIEGYLLPLHLKLELVGEAIPRLATSLSLKTIPYSTPKKKTRKVSPSEVLATKFEKQPGIRLENIELILPYAIPPRWFPPKTSIQTSKQQAKTYQDQRLSHLLPGDYAYYADGSAINKKVGAAYQHRLRRLSFDFFIGLPHFIPYIWRD